MKTQIQATVFTLAILGFQSGSAYSISVPSSSGSVPALPKIESIELSLSNLSGSDCENNPLLDIRIVTNRPGIASYYIFQKGGAISGPFVAKPSSTSNGKFIANISRPLPDSVSKKSEYMISGAGIDAKIRSKWVTFNPDC